MNKLTKDILKEKFDGEKNLGDKPIFIDFYADWWGPCRMFEQVLNKVTPEYEDKVNLYKVNIEEEPEIAGLFQVRSVPTVTTIFKSGKSNSTLGALNEETLKYFLEGLITE